MSRVFTYLCTTLCVFSLTGLSADEDASFSNHDSSVSVIEQPIAEKIQVIQAPVYKAVPEVPFSPFTGKIKARKVRLRLQPSTDSHIIKELTKNDLLVVVGEKEDFWAVEAPSDTKAYVFRSFILDNVVEGNRVNVRLHPDLEAPVIAHLSAGEKIKGSISAANNKWLEIAPPPQTRFYIAKDFIDRVGGPEVKLQLDKRKNAAEQLFDNAAALTKSEMRKPFEEIDIDRIARNYTSIVNDYSDFPEYTEQAKDSLTKLHEAYLQKKIAFLEEKKDFSKEEAFAAKKGAQANKEAPAAPVADPMNDRMKLWEPIEEALYLSWTNLNDNKPMDQYYEEQKIAALPITGILEAYSAPVKNKPGDFIVRDKDLPVAYVYSTQVNLNNLVGKKVTMLGVPRPNNNFAFPAYYVLSVE